MAQDRLALSVARFIDSQGKDYIYRKRESEEYDTEQGSVPVLTSDYSIKGLAFPYTVDQIDGDFRKPNDVRLFVGSLDFENSSIYPEIGDSVLDGEDEKRVMDVRGYEVRGSVNFFELQLREWKWAL